jgi:hypothetical protein
MTIKRILVLANSTKHHPKRCVAGRELIDEVGGKTQWGGWIRPVSNHDEGALDFVERRLADTKDPKPLDTIQLSLSAPENNPLQPENWLIQTGQTWIKETSCDIQALLPLVEEPPDLWLQPSQRFDRVDSVFLKNLSHLQSLYLVRPDSFEFEIRSTTWEGKTKKQLRGLFKYKRLHYDLTLTDPIISRKYFPDFYRAVDGYFKPHDQTKILLCISLTPPFRDGLHYKVIATVLEVST